MAARGLVVAAFALSGCAAAPTGPGKGSRGGSGPEPARLTIELAATRSGAGALALRVQSMTLTAAARTAFVFGTKDEVIRLDGEPAIVAREIQVAPGRYRTLHLQLGSGSTVSAAGRPAPVTGGGEIPVDLDLAPGAAGILLIKLDGERSLRIAPDGSYRLEPVAALVAMAPSESAAFGAIRGRIRPAGASAIVVLRSPRGTVSHAFPHPVTGDFALDELPISAYRVEVNPLEPFLEARAADGVVVPWDGVRDLGVIDLTPPAPAAGGDPDGDVSWQVEAKPAIP